MTKIKICGLSRVEDIQAANALKPDYIGFVFAKSPRQVTLQQAIALKELLHPSIKAVGVFVKETVDNIADIAEKGCIDLIQLHGDESREFCRKLRKSTDKPIIKAIRVKDAASLKELQTYDCDYFLLDAFSAKAFGGVGKSFDYNFLKDAEIPKPFFMAGGLGTDNVQAVIAKINPYGVDISGGVETNKKKDPGKMAKIIQMVRKGDKNND
jgi:phosphoribosylanthranilate isomerase